MLSGPQSDGQDLGHLVRRGYQGNRTCSYGEGLRMAILQTWNGLLIRTLEHHGAPMSPRVFDVAMNFGGPIDY